VRGIPPGREAYNKVFTPYQSRKGEKTMRKANAVFAEFLESRRIGPKVFAERTAWSYHTAWRLKTGRQPFSQHHLDTLVIAGWIARGDDWYRRFEAALRQDPHSLLVTADELKEIIVEALRLFRAAG
jgi:hypothetical protein